MASENEKEELLESEEELLESAEEAPAEAPRAGKVTAEKPPATEEKAPSTAPPPSAPTRRKSCWPWVVVIFLVLVLAVVGLGYWVSHLRAQLAETQAQLEALEGQSRSIGSATKQVGQELLPLADEQIALAKLRADRGDTAGAEYAASQAQHYLDMADKLGANTSDLAQQLQELQTRWKAGPESPPSATEPADTATEPPAEESCTAAPPEEVITHPIPKSTP